MRQKVFAVWGVVARFAVDDGWCVLSWMRVVGAGGPFQGGGLPGVGGEVGGGGPAEGGEDEVEQEGELRAGEEYGGDGDVALEREGGLQQRAGGGCDAGELAVVAGFAGEAGEMHGDKGGIGTEERAPEVELAEGLGEAAAEEDGCPVVGGAEEAEDAGHRHDEVEVGDDKKGVVEVLVEDGLGEDGAGEAAGDEERDEAEGEEHGGGDLRARSPDHGEPAEDLGGGGDGNGDGGDREG